MLNQISTYIGKDTFMAKILSNNTVKMNIDMPENFRKLVKELRLHNISFFTYRLKNERAFEVVIRHLHSSVDTEEIKEAL